MNDLSVTWTGPGDAPFDPDDVEVASAVSLKSLGFGVRVLAVDPGNPCGVALLYGRSGRLVLTELAPGQLADLIHVTHSKVGSIVCERPLYGAVRTFDPEPLKVRGFLELTAWALGITFRSVEVSNLALGRNLVRCAGGPWEGRQHAFDALRYLAADHVMHQPKENTAR